MTHIKADTLKADTYDFDRVLWPNLFLGWWIFWAAPGDFHFHFRSHSRHVLFVEISCDSPQISWYSPALELGVGLRRHAAQQTIFLASQLQHEHQNMTMAIDLSVHHWYIADADENEDADVDLDLDVAVEVARLVPRTTNPTISLATTICAANGNAAVQFSTRHRLASLSNCTAAFRWHQLY